MTVYNTFFTHTDDISTHILTKRMTIGTFTINAMLDISTHILTKRMTGIIDDIKKDADNFNSHPHEEDDCFD